MSARRHKVHLKRGREASVLRRHPWIFSGAIERVEPPLNEPAPVDIFAADGRAVGSGHFLGGSLAVKVLTVQPQEFTEGLWHERLSTALDLRHKLGLPGPDTNCFRLCNGEGDLLPGLIVDVYGDTLVIEYHSPAMRSAAGELRKALNTLWGGKEAVIIERFPDPKAEGEPEVFGERSLIARRIKENGLTFAVDLLGGQKTGFFLDQRENRALLERYCRNRRVLNAFSYSGGFSLYALRGGARTVASVDSSRAAIALAEENVALNGFAERHVAHTADYFTFMREGSAGFDLIVLDPPAFAKHRGALSGAIKGYKGINSNALRNLNPGGLLFTFSCSQVVSKEDFRQMVLSAALEAGRDVRVLHELRQAPCHPVSIYHPEGEYLKGLVLAVN